tara:strand:- start:4964 stop:5164 length:201 start_codon:yes stop_codon:yes gene_type:complete
MNKRLKELKWQSRIMVLIIFVPVISVTCIVYLLILLISLLIKIIDWCGIWDAITYSLNKFEDVFSK